MSKRSKKSAVEGLSFRPLSTQELLDLLGYRFEPRIYSSATKILRESPACGLLPRPARGARSGS